jgi:TrpR-related protein YerC/YecD
MKDKISDEMLDTLFDTLAMIDTAEDFRMFLTDLCSKSEIMKMAQRIKAAKLLSEGHTYNQVISLTDISSTTLSRVSVCLKNGAGGYLKFIVKDE